MLLAAVLYDSFSMVIRHPLLNTLASILTPVQKRTINTRSLAIISSLPAAMPAPINSCKGFIMAHQASPHSPNTPIDPYAVVPCPDPVSAPKIRSLNWENSSQRLACTKLQYCEKHHCGYCKKANRELAGVRGGNQEGPARRRGGESRRCCLLHLDLLTCIVTTDCGWYICMLVLPCCSPLGRGISWRSPTRPIWLTRRFSFPASL